MCPTIRILHRNETIEECFLVHNWLAFCLNIMLAGLKSYIAGMPIHHFIFSIKKTGWIFLLCLLVAKGSFADVKFIPNNGQWAPNILYEAGLSGSSQFYLEKNEITYFFFDEDAL